MADRSSGVLLASIRMALGLQSPMTAGQIAAHITRSNPQRPFRQFEVIAVLRAHRELFIVDGRRFFGLGPQRWSLLPAAAATYVESPPVQPTRAEPRPLPRAAVPQSPPPPPTPLSPSEQKPAQRGLELIDDRVGTTSAPRARSAEAAALKREIQRRRSKRGPAPTRAIGDFNYRDVIDKKHPINRLSDETLNRLAADVHIDSE